MNKEVIARKNEYRDCPKCGFETFDELSNCPNCSNELHTESKIRSAGSLGVVIGFLLTFMMSGLFVGLTALFIYVKYYGNEQGRKNFSSTEGNILIMAAYVFVCSILGFAVAMIFAGRHAIKHGRRDRKKIKIALTVLFVGLGILGLIQVLLG